jgi:RecA/RadA recombinase
MSFKPKKEEKLGKLSADQISNIINKKAGMNVAFSLNQDNPASVKDWIPTGSTWLDAIIAKGRMGGIPVGKIAEVAGLEGCVTEDTLIEVEIDD